MTLFLSRSSVIVAIVISILGYLVIVSHAQRTKAHAAALGTMKLIYASDDRLSSELARMGSRDFHLQTLDMHSSEGSKAIFGLIPKGEVTVPTLYFSTPTGSGVIKGLSSVAEVLDAPGKERITTVEAAIQLCSMLLLIWLLPVISSSLASFLTAVPILGLIVSAVTSMGACPTCRSELVWHGIEPGHVGAGVFFILMLGLGSPSIMNRRIGRCGLAGLAAIGLCTQSVLLYFEPKFCSLCLLVSACFASILIVLALLEQGSHVRTVRVGSKAFASVLFAWIAMTASAQFARKEDPKTGPPMPVEFQGKAMASLFDGFKPQADGGLVVVSLPSCHVCQDAKADLIAHRIPFEEMRPCSDRDKPPCFRTNGSMQVPIILKYDKAGKISLGVVGWGRSLVYQSLISDHLARK